MAEVYLVPNPMTPSQAIFIDTARLRPPPCSAQKILAERYAPSIEEQYEINPDETKGKYRDAMPQDRKEPEAERKNG
jgi:hypothetical protein